MRRIAALAVLVAALDAAEPATAGRHERFVVSDAMTWSTPYSSRFRRHSRPDKPDAGWYENGPLVPDDSRQARMRNGGDVGVQRFLDARAAGIDVVSIDWFDDSPLDMYKAWADAAHRSGTGVKVAFFVNSLPKDDRSLLRRAWERPDLKDHPGLFRIGGDPVVVSYEYAMIPAMREALAQAAAAGVRYRWYGDCSGLPAVRFGSTVPDQVVEGLSVADGAFFFGNFTLSWDQPGLLPDFMARLRAARPGIAVGASVRNGYIGVTKIGCLIPGHGTELMRRQWGDIIAHDADFVQLSTLNDYGEDSSQEWSANNASTYIELNRYFGERWRTGAWPVLDGPRAFLSYRKTVAPGEPLEVELVLLRPQGGVDGLAATLALVQADGRAIGPVAAPAEAWPGHVVWRFRVPQGVLAPGYAWPRVGITDGGRPLALPAGDLAALAVIEPGEAVQRAWQRVPLHRVYAGDPGRVVVRDERPWPSRRVVGVEGLPDGVHGGLVLRSGHAFTTVADPADLVAGLVDTSSPQAGYDPMWFADEDDKRSVVDRTDRYTAVLRLRDGRVAYPRPLLTPAPRRPRAAAPAVDPATVFDWAISAGSTRLRDRGALHQDLDLAAQAAPPTVVEVRAGGPAVLRFDGAKQRIDHEAPALAPGPATVELWLRPARLDRPQALFCPQGDVLGLVLTPRGRELPGGLPERYLRGWLGDPPPAITEPGRVVLSRLDPRRRAVEVVSDRALEAGRWHQVAGVFSGHDLTLYLDGRPAGAPVPVEGLVMEERRTCIGGWWSGSLKGFAGDLARVRVLQRALVPAEVEAACHEMREALHGGE